MNVMEAFGVCCIIAICIAAIFAVIAFVIYVFDAFKVVKCDIDRMKHRLAEKLEKKEP